MALEPNKSYSQTAETSFHVTNVGSADRAGAGTGALVRD
jgi:hypothetical protein